ncbi:MAG: MFS transporter [Candidatus Magnetoovum sp. WYHC-5]|nr:MFS transporter [Candidatus Magnetoovum sp. WYHC-5]
MPYLEVFKSRKIAVMLFLGYSSGLPLSLTGSTLQAWLSVTGVDIRTIGLFAFIGLPYTIKFLWSPLIDRFSPPLLGRRRGWIFITQFLLLCLVGGMSFLTPNETPVLLAAIAFAIAFVSASQDIVIDAYRTDLLSERQRGAGTAVFVTGYRVAMLLSGALAMIISSSIGWHYTYILMAALMFVGMLGVLIGKEPEVELAAPRTLHDAVVGPLKDFFSRPYAVSLLILIVLYKLGDAYAGTLTTAFLIKGLNFTPVDVGTINKGIGLLSLIVGAVVGGSLMVRLGLFMSLFYFGILQAISNLSFMVLAWVGKSYLVMVFAVCFENLTGGMGTAAFVSLIMALCNARFSATQFALLSSLASLGRVFVAPSSGYLVTLIDWDNFFLFTGITAIPGIILLWILRRHIPSSIPS